ncbi:ZIP family metal transporter [Candidatus Woesearchaeota archaeon]|nr:ZIP family metal transporter [Candidatus Woesearchaeota archaeon]MBW3018363.1 ZIP family metal transporter [Candidatus Woesearchaeota archaeon]
MYEVWLYSIVSVIIVSLISLIGIVAFLLNNKNLKKILLFLVSFSAGGLFGGAFIHLLPEAVGQYGFEIKIGLFLLLGILFFFVVEKFIHWRHCHIPTSKEHPHPFAYTNLVGDGVHNLIDGLVIGGSYLVSIPLGISTTIAVLLHEIPQEIGDFGVLVHGGFTRKKALFLNLMTALVAVIGVVISLLIGVKFQNYALFLLPFTAGGFIYIAGSDLIPELHKEVNPLRSLFQLIAIILGACVMLLLTYL